MSEPSAAPATAASAAPRKALEQPWARFVVLAKGNSDTHTVFEVLCGAGFPAVHYLLECDTQARGADTLRLSPLEVLDRRHSHLTSRQPWHHELMVLYGNAMNPRQSPLSLTVRDWSSRVLVALKEASLARHSLMDSPYSAFPAVLASTEFASRTPVTIPRLSFEWAKSRQREHGLSPLCHRRLWAVAWHPRNMSDPLDLLQCAQACILAAGELLSLREGRCFEPENNISLSLLTMAHRAHLQHVTALIGTRAVQLPFFDNSIPRQSNEDVARLLGLLVPPDSPAPPANVSRAAAITKPDPLAITEADSLRINTDKQSREQRDAVELVIVSVMKWETPYIGEWLAYHQALGVRWFILVPNECEQRDYEAWAAAIAPFRTPGVAVINAFRCAKNFQGHAYTAAVRHALLEWPQLSPASTRLAFYDLDEFLVLGLAPNHTLNTLLAEFPATAAVWSLTSHAFGDSHRTKRPLIGGVVSNFVLRASMRASTEPVGGRTIAAPLLRKSVCQLSAMADNLRWTLATAYATTHLEMAPNAAHNCLPDNTNQSFNVPADVLRLNHYTSKSREEWEIKKTRSYADHHSASKPRSGLPPPSYSANVDLRAPITLLAACNWHVGPSMCSDEAVSLTALDHAPWPNVTAQLLQAYCMSHSSVLQGTLVHEACVRLTLSRTPSLLQPPGPLQSPAPPRVAESNTPSMNGGVFEL